MGGGRAGHLHPSGRRRCARSCTAATPASPCGHRWRQDAGIPGCQGHQSPPSPPLRWILFTPWKKQCVGKDCSLLPSPFPPSLPKINPPKAITSSDELPSAHCAPKSPQMHDAGSPRACIFPAGPCLGCSWLRRAESCRCDLFICLQPPALPPSCFPSPLPPEPT